MGYRAFFSYARADDNVANWLHGQLDSYRTPRILVGTQGALGPVPTKLFPIFRDRTDLQAGGHVDAALQKALEDSETLVVLCTPTSAKSHWVNHECETFLRLGREAHIFPVIAAGEPNSSDPDTECFPPALRNRGLLAADLREIRLPNGQLVGDGREGGRLKLIAGLLGVGLDQLAQRERRRQRQFMVALGIAATTFAVVAAAAVVLGVLADRNANVAEERAAVLSIEAARSELSRGGTDAALLLLLEAAKTFTAETAPDDLLIALDEALLRAGSEDILAVAPESSLYELRNGAAIASPTGTISVVTNTSGPALFAEAGAPVLFITDDFRGDSLLAVRNDLSVVRLTQGAATQVLGAFTHERFSENRDGPSFLRWTTGETLRTTAPFRSGTLVEAFDPGTGQVRTISDESHTLQGGLEACDMNATLRAEVLNYFGGRGGELAGCRAYGSRGLITFYTSGSGGDFRHDLIIDPEGLNFESDQKVVSASQLMSEWTSSISTYLNGRLVGDYETSAQSFVGIRDDAMAIASNRQLAYLPFLDDTIEWPTTNPILFAALLSDGALLISEGGSNVRIFNPAKAFAYNRTDADFEVNRRECLEESSSSVRNEGSSALIAGNDTGVTVAFDGGAQIHLPSDGCSIASEDGRYIIIDNGGVGTLFDVNRLREGQQAARVPDVTITGRRQFASASHDILVASGASVVLLEEASTFRARRIYSGDRPVDLVDLSPDRRFLLVREALGGSYYGGFVYSLEAQRVWRRLGTDYKWYWAGFTGPRDIDVYSERHHEHVRLHTFDEAVAAAHDAINGVCRDFDVDNYTRSSCWPESLRR